MCVLVMVCCGPGAGTRTPLLTARPTSSISSSIIRTRAFAGLLPLSSSSDPKVHGYEEAGLNITIAPYHLAQWLYPVHTSGASSERCGFESGFEHPASSRHASCVLRLASFGDLATAVTTFWSRIISFVLVSTSSDPGPVIVVSPSAPGKSISSLTSPALEGIHLAERGYAASEPKPDPALLAMLPGAPGRALDRHASSPSPTRSPDAAVPSTIGDYNSVALMGLSAIAIMNSRLPNLGRLSVLLACTSSVDAVCIHCKDTITGCGGGDNCPAFKAWTANTDIFKERKIGGTPNVGHSLTAELASHFTRPVVEAVVGLACAPEMGKEINFEDAAYAKCSAIVQACAYGHCSAAEAMSVLTRRMDDTDEAIAISKLKAAMDAVKLQSESVVSSASGYLTFLWTKVSTVLGKRGSGVARIELNSEKSKAQSLSATLVRPTTYEQFDEMRHYFMMVLVGLGISSYFIVAKFYDDVVYACLRMGESWQVAFELVGLYCRDIDRDPTRTLHLGNAYQRGAQDTLLAEARRNAAAFFRTRGGEPRDERPPITETGDKRGIKHNGKFDTEAKQCCIDFNMGRPCKKLKPDGTCKFNHRCNQFVADKGAKGVCFGTHARCHGCDYDESKKLSKPAEA
jgi:hypothetical protein